MPPPPKGKGKGKGGQGTVAASQVNKIAADQANITKGMMELTKAVKAITGANPKGGKASIVDAKVETHQNLAAAIRANLPKDSAGRSLAKSATR